MGQIIRDKEKNFVDEVYDYAGLWGLPSKCGLKIVIKNNQTIAIITELYEDNPGTSVTEYCPKLAEIITQDKKIKPEELFFILHTPDVGSKYEFLHETFDIVHFKIDNGLFSEPRWERIAREKVVEMISD
ncbi:MAG: hypothetical protein KGZ97_01850 [Bacteroidetes bacterium]|nr:hypothetical protein [Bacteroidota bacterium]